MGKKKTERSHPISFLLGDSYIGLLEQMASKEGISIHQKARDIVRAVLDGDERELIALRHETEETKQEVTSVKREVIVTQRIIQDFREGVADALEALLIREGGSQEKVRAWIDERLRRRNVIN